MSERAADVLEQIVTRTRLKVAERQMSQPLDRLLARSQTRRPRRPFAKALSAPGGPHVIAEFKRRSPSRGIIREDLQVVHVAHAYQLGGATALSVLTEPEWFGGSLEDLKQARAVSRLPVLRKDFIVDPYQIWESWHAEADALLLIVAALTDGQLERLLATAAEANVETLVEVHDQAELARALGAGARVVGVNNRDLRTLEVNLRTSERLAERIPDDVVAVAESGVRSGHDLRRLAAVGFDACLVGEQLMSSPDPGAALSALIADARGEEASPR
jgi:indole-3-glycerol phosphate synthase